MPGFSALGVFGSGGRDHVLEVALLIMIQNPLASLIHCASAPESIKGLDMPGTHKSMWATSWVPRLLPVKSNPPWLHKSDGTQQQPSVLGVHLIYRFLAVPSSWESTNLRFRNTATLSSKPFLRRTLHAEHVGD